jgi:MFS family permease
MVIASGVGYFCAALVTPAATRRLAKPTWIALLVAASAVVTIALGETFNQLAYLALGFCLYLARQGVAICATTILQEELPDEFRGRAFSYYDMMFNITFAAGALICLPFMPANGKSAGLMAFVGIGYVVVAAGYWAASRHSAGPGAPGGSMPADAAQASSS